MDHQISVKNPGAIKVIVLLSSFIAMLSETSINVALTHLMEHFQVSVSTIQWLVTGFMLVMAIVVPVTAFIIQHFRDRSIYFASSAFIIVGSVLSLAASSFGMLLVGRLIQAVGTCIMMTLTVNIVLRLSGPGGSGMAMGLIGLVTLFAPAVAPSLAGLLLQTLGWRWIFAAPLILFVIAVIAAFIHLQDVTPQSHRKFSPSSFILEALGFGGLLFAISGLSEDTGLPTGIYVIFGIIGAISLVSFVILQLKLAHPLVNLRVFRSGMFTIAMLAVFFCILTVFGITVMLPILFIQFFGLSSAIAGLAMLPGGMLNGLVAPAFGKLYDKVGARGPVITGMFGVIIALALYAFMPAGTALWAYIGVHCLVMVSISLVMTVSQANGMNHIDHELYPHGTAVMSTLMQLGGGFGSAVYVSAFSVFAITGHSAIQPVVGGFKGAFTVGAIVFLIPFIASFFTKKRNSKAETLA